MRIGAFVVASGLLAAPMAGVTDRPFRTLCRRLGAALAVAEMVSCAPRLRGTAKSRRRTDHDTDHDAETEPRVVQIAGADPRLMADAARYNADCGAQIIDINMGCPAKKICKRAAGSALLGDEALVGRILDAVVSAVDVPVTLKIRTGPSPRTRNGTRIARIAEASGIAALTVHGRTRACAFTGRAEYATIRAIKDSVRIPVVANGDIVTPEDAARVLRVTGADGVMIGRAAQGNPWVFREIAHYLRTGERLARPTAAERQAVLGEHLRRLHEFYGEAMGVRVARKHLAWYCRKLPGGECFWRRIRRIDSAAVQLRMAGEFLGRETVARDNMGLAA